MSSIATAPRLSGVPRGVLVVLLALVAIVLAWRVVVIGVDALHARADAEREDTAMPQKTADREWREQLARDPTNAGAMLSLALALETQGNQSEAAAAMRQALRLAPWSQRTLMHAASYFLRAGDEAQAIATLRRALDVSSDVNASVWQVFLTALDSERNRDFFLALARDNPTWWPGFFHLACEQATNADELQVIFAARVRAAVATVDERRLLVERLQRDGRWADARQVWRDSLPVDEQQRTALLFNGGFELPISNLGFDWLVPVQEGVEVTRQPIDGMTGQRALNVTFANKRYSEPPIYQYLVLDPGAYRLGGQGRTDLETWLGMQWAVYCQAAAGQEQRQLAHSDRFIGAMDWRDFRLDFVVPRDCPIQVLRLELANPKRDATAPGAVIVRLKGRLWFDALEVRPLG